MIVYMATNKSNNKKYIGLTTKSLSERKKTHERDAKRGTTYFNKAIRKYGIDGFEWEILDTAETIEELQQKEIEYIEKFKTFNNKEIGYNSTSGGQYFQVTDEEKQRRSERAKGENNPMYGVPSPMKGKKFSDAHRAKLSESAKKVKRDWLNGETNPSATPVIELTTMNIFPTQREAILNTGVSQTGLTYSIEEDRYIKGFKFAKYEEGKSYQKVPKGPTRNVPVINIDTGKRFDSISKAAEFYNCARKGIRDCCNKERSEYKGYKWEYF